MPAAKSLRPALPRAPRVRSWTAALEGVVPDRVLFSPWLKRLARISFLGALDHAPACRQRPSRLDHSAGAATLALAQGRALKLDVASLKLLVTAALLHDIGHYPLSHTAESAFRARLGADHHDVSRFIVLGDGPISREASLAPALEEGGVDPARAWALIDGDESSPLAPLLTGAVNLDTLDGIPRAARAFGLRAPRLPECMLALRDGRLFARREAISALDRFWRLKDRVYREIINAPAHAALELRLSALVGRNVNVDGDALAGIATLDDAALLAMLSLNAKALAPDAAERASRFVASADPRLAPVRVLREYDVDERVAATSEGLPIEDWPRRWRTSKHRWFLVTRSSSVQLLLPASWETEGDLP